MICCLFWNTSDSTYATFLPKILIEIACFRCIVCNIRLFSKLILTIFLNMEECHSSALNFTLWIKNYWWCWLDTTALHVHQHITINILQIVIDINLVYLHTFCVFIYSFTTFLMFRQGWRNSGEFNICYTSSDGPGKILYYFLPTMPSYKMLTNTMVVEIVYQPLLKK